MAALAFSASSAAFAIDLLTPGQQLTTGQVVYSPDNLYYAIMQTDGNFVIYRTGGAATWSTNTAGRGAVRAEMQNDGNFVLYTANNAAVWASNTSGHPNSFLTVQSTNSAGQPWGGLILWQEGPVWASNTSLATPPANSAPIIFSAGEEIPMGQDYYQDNGRFDFRFQTDGNVVVYDTGKAVWASNTENRGAVKAVVVNGTIQLEGASGNVIANVSGTSEGFYSSSGSYIAFQADGNLVAYGSNQIWGAGPAGQGNGGNCYGTLDQCNPTFSLPIFTWD